MCAFRVEVTLGGVVGGVGGMSVGTPTLVPQNVSTGCRRVPDQVCLHPSVCLHPPVCLYPHTFTSLPATHPHPQDWFGTDLKIRRIGQYWTQLEYVLDVSGVCV